MEEEQGSKKVKRSWNSGKHYQLCHQSAEEQREKLIFGLVITFLEVKSSL